MSTEDIKGLTVGSLLWIVIAGSYLFTAIGFKLIIDWQRDAIRESQAVHAQLNAALNQIVTERDRRFQEVERRGQEGLDQRAEKLNGMFRDLQDRLEKVAQQQAEMRADMRNLQELKNDLKTLLEKRK